MNKQETIKKLESIKVIGNDAIAACCNQCINAGITLMKKIDESQKPVIPQLVAGWLEKSTDPFTKAEKIAYLIKSKDGDSYYFCDWFVRDGIVTQEQGEELLAWAKRQSCETLLSLYNGYEVEKEPLYRVKIGEGYFVEYQGRGALIMPDCNKEIKIFDSKTDAERTAQTIGGTVEEVAKR
ncbi:TPA: DUF1642 domain-containing protein [Enterococcus faecium]|nr:DUF1642 domain-containing protein [Enterococcus faecium]HAQ4793230.1 DUF1642 domain-containing protein [Enterococcus faecium]HAQ5140697.1 DUF1642 domain-containing protein [Enterococcus faecium]HAQ5172254.1 DUF1642 domain-containing protein [Enterococcus faecium]HAQ5211917.1 DUF1642 domain-containing protein [Enterococcus faecium]